MNLRVKLILAFVGISVAASVAVTTGTYLSTVHNFDAEINESLEGAATQVLATDARHGNREHDVDHDDEHGIHQLPRGYERFVVQKLRADGSIEVAAPSLALPVNDADRALARSGQARQRERRNIQRDDDNWRLDTISLGNAGGAVQIARSTTENDRLLDGVRHRAFLAVGLTALAAGLIGWLIARGITRRLIALTSAAEQVATTGRLDAQTDVGGKDETGRLASAFNAMLAALADSKRQQHQLVHDASHELRTPLTSLRTNVVMLRRFDRLDANDQRQLIDDLDSETKELNLLVNELVELATERRNEEPRVDIELAVIVEQAVERARRRTSRVINLDVRSPRATVTVSPSRIDRAITNLLDNAIKFSVDTPVSETIDVTIDGTRVEVADRGIGFTNDDASKLFERFYRTDEARSRPGSGLGLAITHDAITDHDGTVFATPRDGGGATIGFDLLSVSAHSHETHNRSTGNP